jgi:cation:H+ antiporter
VPAALSIPLFLAGAAASLATSWLLVSRLERIGERLGLSEGLLGVLAALAADAPEITSAVTALASHERDVGAGVVIGSNVFNLAALLGLGAVVAGRIGLHRRVLVFGGTAGIWVAVACLVTVAGGTGPGGGLLLALLAFGPYLVLLGAGPGRLARGAVAPRWQRWLRAAVTEEEQELGSAIRPRPARPVDWLAAALAAAAVVAASVVMERAASAMGGRYGIPQVVTGGLVLAAVTSLPNAVAAVYLAGRGRGAATLSTTLNSNALNVLAGLFLPGLFIGLGAPSGQTILIAAWYLALTVLTLALAYADHGLRRPAGAVIIAGYLLFAGVLLLTA